MDEQQQTDTVPPEAPQPSAKSYVYVGGSSIPVLETYDEIAALLEDADPGAFIELTVSVQQAEVQHIHPVLAALTARAGFTRARYRESYVTGYIEVLPPEIDHGE